jgi:hypothetical protein
MLRGEREREDGQLKLKMKLIDWMKSVLPYSSFSLSLSLSLPYAIIFHSDVETNVKKSERTKGDFPFFVYKTPPP